MDEPIVLKLYKENECYHINAHNHNTGKRISLESTRNLSNARRIFHATRNKLKGV